MGQLQTLRLMLLDPRVGAAVLHTPPEENLGFSLFFEMLAKAAKEGQPEVVKFLLVYNPQKFGNVDDGHVRAVLFKIRRNQSEIGQSRTCSARSPQFRRKGSP